MPPIEPRVRENVLGMGLTVKQKAWLYETKASIRSVVGQEGGLLMEVRPTDYPKYAGNFAGVGETIREATENAITLNPECTV